LFEDSLTFTPKIDEFGSKIGSAPPDFEKYAIFLSNPEMDTIIEDFGRLKA